jgi:hypothetical protein
LALDESGAWRVDRLITHAHGTHAGRGETGPQWLSQSLAADRIRSACLIRVYPLLSVSNAFAVIARRVEAEIGGWRTPANVLEWWLEAGVPALFRLRNTLRTWFG